MRGTELRAQSFRYHEAKLERRDHGSQVPLKVLVAKALLKLREPTFVPNLICDLSWLPFRFGRLFAKVLWQFFRFILLCWFLAVGLTLLASVAHSGASQGEFDVGLFAILFVCVLVGGGICLSDLLRHE